MSRMSGRVCGVGVVWVVGVVVSIDYWERSIRKEQLGKTHYKIVCFRGCPAV